MKYIPHSYQQYCIDSIIYNKAIGLFLDMGLGKTVVTLTAIHELRFNRWEIAKPLIIAPKKWQRPHGLRRRQNGTIPRI